MCIILFPLLGLYASFIGSRGSGLISHPHGQGPYRYCILLETQGKKYCTLHGVFSSLLKLAATYTLDQARLG